MKTLELRLDPEAARPLVERLRVAREELVGDLAIDAKPPEEEDELMSGIWKDELLKSQNADVEAVAALFDDHFFQTGATRINPENADPVLRGCSALRLKLRETSLAGLEDSDLEGGEIDFESLDLDARVGYGAYSLLASLQELIVAQLHG